MLNGIGLTDRLVMLFSKASSYQKRWMEEKEKLGKGKNMIPL